MLVAETYLGHRSEEVVTSALAEAETGTGGGVHRVVLTDTERRRSRVRTETADGTDLGIVVARELADGDVLRTENGGLLVVELAAVEALVVDLAGADAPTTAAVAFGHAVGNRHWDMAVRGTEVLFPVADDRERMERFVRAEAPAGATLHTERVPPTTFDDGGPDHSHGPSLGDDHAHEDGSHLRLTDDGGVAGDGSGGSDR
ncbi:urease accessory protein UreE [Haloglomus salinum]|uniref:urease accessory protein UreE n=1 Tax=Haloglomus salinum TaxID=2962673 RepID=UPI0020C94EA0|nr:urease accessory protein UreE [Haloglomus salinum]